ncbi:MAG: McrC family protein [Proteobacteria bacterium]|nr:McrC family protein [Pseudomonadota bacterium]
MTGPRTALVTIDLVEFKKVERNAEDFVFLSPEHWFHLEKELAGLVSIHRSRDGSQIIFQAGSRVGTAFARGVRVQVRPRLAVHLFLQLLHYVLSGQMCRKPPRALLDVSRGVGFEDALAFLLAHEVREIQRIGVSRKYEERREPLQALRGRPLWERNFPWDPDHASRIVCRHHWLTYDNPDNRLLLAGLRKAATLVDSREIRGQIVNHLNTFSHLASEVSFTRADLMEEQWSYTRLNEHYQCAHQLCRMFLAGLRPSSLFEGGDSLVPGVALDMAMLFERFVGRFLGEALGPHGFVLHTQKSDNRALYDGEGGRYASVRPDFELWRAGRFEAVVDAKYKDYWSAQEKGRQPTKKIRNEDLYQLFFYQQRLRHRHGLPALPPSFIASPLPDLEEREGRPVLPERYRTIIWKSEIGEAGCVRLILIPVTRYLESLVTGKGVERILLETASMIIDYKNG